MDQNEAARKFIATRGKGGSLQRLGPGTYQLVSKRFDQDTGVELSPVVISMDPKGVQLQLGTAAAKRDEAQAEVDALQSLLDRMAALDE